MRNHVPKIQMFITLADTGEAPSGKIVGILVKIVGVLPVFA